MNRSETEKRMIIIGLAFLIFLSFGLLKATVRAADAPEKTDVTITDLKFLDQDQSAVSRGCDSRPYYLEIGDRKSTRLNSSHPVISYAVFCLKKKKIR